MPSYAVTIDFVEEATSPTAAAKQIATYLDETSAFSLVYRVVGEDGGVTDVDMGAITEYDVEGEVVFTDDEGDS